MTTDERLAYLGLALTPGIGPVRLRALEQTFGSFGGAWSAPFALLCTVPGISRAAATAIRTVDRGAVRRVLEALEGQGGQALVPGDAAWPARLDQLAVPPPVLFALGRLELLDRPAVAVVGSRQPSTYGVGVTREIAGVAAVADLVVVSGMARGLDAVAHTAALEAAGGTIGVLGNGFGVVYPAANAALYARVAREGLLLSEYPPGERPNAGSFPRRNRIIAGLASVTVVVEAAVRSGALGTAQWALDQGRDVMAVPGPLRHRLSEGTNRLLQSGAAMFLEPDDLLALFPGVSPAVRARFRPGLVPPAVAELERDQRRVYLRLAGTPKDVDAIAWEAGLSAAEVLVALTELELAGLVERDPAGFVRA